jgi:universal stress protein A
MAAYKHILYAVDLNEDIESLVNRAITSAQKDGSKITILHITQSVTSLYAAGYFVASEAFVQLEEDLTKEAENKLKEIVKPHASDNISIVIELHDSPKEQIIDKAKALAVDAIYLNGHKHNFIGRLGSVADYVINQADCDVVILKNTN